ncbi:MAG TPA: hypothetical protein EYP78_06285 [Candidatus Omnitrophica bacterium]|nr:hypothetical protein [Candidatus Omnitrophota bacterium]
MNTRLLQILDGMKGKRILVWGDLICDEYIHGEVWRISREAPVLILKKTGTEYHLGGAANAANNLAALEAEVSVMGVVGEDGYQKRLLSLLKEKNIDTSGVTVDKKFSTISKTRIMAGGLNRPKQQVIRIDDGEKIDSDSRKISSRFREYLRSVKSSIDGVIVSDYSYGTVNSEIYDELVEELSKKNIPVTVDSRFDLVRYKNATLLTPNEEEVAHALGTAPEEVEKDILTMGKRVLRQLNPKILVLTRGRKGMEVFEEGEKPRHIPIHGSDEVTDVTGAGDTVCSVATLALSCGASGYEAAQLANYAAGMVVMKMGCATVTTEELKKALKSEKEI